MVNWFGVRLNGEASKASFVDGTTVMTDDDGNESVSLYNGDSVTRDEDGNVCIIIDGVVVTVDEDGNVSVNHPDGGSIAVCEDGDIAISEFNDGRARLVVSDDVTYTKDDVPVQRIGDETGRYRHSLRSHPGTGVSIGEVNVTGSISSMVSHGSSSMNVNGMTIDSDVSLSMVNGDIIVSGKRLEIPDGCRHVTIRNGVASYYGYFSKRLGSEHL